MAKDKKPAKKKGAEAPAPATDKPKSHLSKADYLAELEPLELALNNLARWLQHTGKRLAVVFEGRDTAGKGGAIADTLNPRQCHVVALSKPASASRPVVLPALCAAPAGGQRDHAVRPQLVQPRRCRAGDGLLQRGTGPAFLAQAPVFEKLLVDDGLLLLKYWLTVDQAEQEQRFAERLQDPLKRWKLSPIDLQARSRYADYGAARDAMLAATHTAHAPWTLVDFNDQRRGRLALIRHLLAQVPDTSVPPAPLTMPPLPAAPLQEHLPRRFSPI